MSKASRRRQRPGNQPTTNRPTGSPSGGQANPTGAAGGSTVAGGSAGAGAGTAAGASASGAGRSGRDRTSRHVRHGRATELDRCPSRPPRTPANDLPAVVHGALPNGDRRRRGHRRYRPPVGLRLPPVIAAGLRLLDHLDAGADGLSRPGCHPEPRLCPARHGQQPRLARRQGHLHVLRPGIRIARQPPRSRRPDPRTRLRSDRQRHPAGLDPQPRAWRAGHPVQDRQRRRDARRPGQVQGLLRGLPAGAELRSRSSPRSTR